MITKEYTIDIELYNQTFNVVFGEDVMKCMNEIETLKDVSNKEDFASADGITLEIYKKVVGGRRRMRYIIIGLGKEHSPVDELVVHEAFHMTSTIMSSVDSTHNPDNEEPWAYLMEYVYKLIMEKYREYELLIKDPPTEKNNNGVCDSLTGTSKINEK